MYTLNPNFYFENAESQNEKLIVLDLINAKFIELNEIAKYIFLNIIEGKSIEDISKSICQTYDVTPPKATKDVSDVVNMLESKGIILPLIGKKEVSHA